ncbi:MAG: stage II sporulation protein M [Nanoarchaeota archaeon]|nr:stage II sporulation protein M [Nanoarchaeota archaeon]MBU1027669.1 stage II sporulation protein M [Nanoarchaeota archaeon]
MNNKKVKRKNINKKYQENFRFNIWIGLFLFSFILLLINFIAQNLIKSDFFPLFLEYLLFLIILFSSYVYFWKLGRPFFKSKEFIKSSRIFIYIIVGVFVFFALFGFFVPVPEAIGEKILDFLKQILDQTKDMSYLELTKFIFFNNLQSSFFGIIFGIFSIVLAILNGLLLGFVSSIGVNSEGFFILWRLFPHGIFELPAVFIALGLGLRLGLFVFSSKKRYFFKNNLFNSLRVFLFVILPLLGLAAFIESTLIFLVG